MFLQPVWVSVRWAVACSSPIYIPLLLYDLLIILVSSIPNTGPLLLSGLKNQQNPVKAPKDGSVADPIPPTPDVDQLLECTFSYTKAEADGGLEQQLDDDGRFPRKLPASTDETVGFELISTSYGLVLLSIILTNGIKNQLMIYFYFSTSFNYDIQ